MHKELQDAIEAYIFDTENYEKTYRLANIYESLGQTASAITFLLKTAERTGTVELAYECLLRIGNCFDKQGERDNTVKGMYKQAMMLCPQRPEAYFLLARFHERRKQFVDAYTTAELGLRISTPHPPLKGYTEYPGEYGLMFEKAVSAWWWGRPRESRQLFRHIADEYYDKLDRPHFDAVKRNLENLGIGPGSHKYFSKEKYGLLRHIFTGAENLNRNYSQAFQDLFVLMMLNGMKEGTYLEIGSAGPYYGNNTALLEKQFGWSGMGIDFDQEACKKYRKERENPVICEDAREVDYEEVCHDLTRFSARQVIDYLQLDCEPSDVTYDILLKIPFDKYKFAVITYEHDHYLDMTKSYRTLSRDYLRSKGYVLVVSDVSPDGISSFEDWWVHPDLVDSKLLEKMMHVDKGITDIEQYIYSTPPLIPGFDWGDIAKNIWFYNMVQRENFVDRIYERYVKVEEGDIVVDIGASVGPFIKSITMDGRKYERIIAVEPSYNLLTTLNKNFQNYHDTPIAVYNSAITNTDGNSVINGMYNPDSITTGDNLSYVSSMKFRTLIKEQKLSKIDFLKIDCEGGEYDIFNDENFEWITKNVRKISGEFHLETYDQKLKFRKFRDTYLKHFAKYWVESVDYVDIKWDLWTDTFIEFYSCINIHIDNTKPKKFKYGWATQYPTMEVTTIVPERGCIVKCAYCPQNVLISAYKDPIRNMTLENFKKALETIPEDVRITFSGFVEPWMNRECTQMVQYAHEKGHPVCVFTTAVGMKPEDVELLSKIPYHGGPNGGFVLHLPDQERIAKHPITQRYIRTVEEFGKYKDKFQNFSVMSMSETVHESVRHVFPTAHTPEFWHRAGNLIKETRFNPATADLYTKGKFQTIEHDRPKTCGCVEDLYHNVLLPNGDVSLCCMDYGLDQMLGNIFETPYNDVIPKPNMTFDLCRSCENGVDPRVQTK